MTQLNEILRDYGVFTLELFIELHEHFHDGGDDDVLLKYWDEMHPEDIEALHQAEMELSMVKQRLSAERLAQHQPELCEFEW